MCEYCRVDENGDIDYTAIIDSPYEHRLCASVGVNGNAGTMIAQIYYPGAIGDSLEYQEVKIHYCPMCGRKLGEVDNV